MDFSFGKILGCAGFVGACLTAMLLYPFLVANPETLFQLETKEVRVSPGDLFHVSARVIGAEAKDPKAREYSPQGYKLGPQWGFEGSNGGRILGGNASDLMVLAPNSAGSYTLTAKFPGWFGGKMHVKVEVADHGNLEGPALGLVTPDWNPRGAVQWNWTGDGYREGASVTLLRDGSVLIAGGSAPDPKTSALRYWPQEGRAAVVGPMNLARSGHDAVLLKDGRVLLLGGNNPRDGELFDPATNSFISLPTVPVDQPAVRLALLPNGEVLVYPYVPAEKAWFMPINTNSVMAFVVNPASKSSRPVGPILAQRECPTLSPLPDGRVLVVGAPIVKEDPHRKSAPSAAAMTELYLSDQGSFAPGPSLITGRRDHLAVSLRNGETALIGGWMYAWSTSGGSGFASCPRMEVLSADGRSSREAEAYNQSPSAAVTMMDGGLLLVQSGQLVRLHLGKAGNGTWSQVCPRVTTAARAITLPDGRALVIGSAPFSARLFYP